MQVILSQGQPRSWAARTVVVNVVLVWTFPVRHRRYYFLKCHARWRNETMVLWIQYDTISGLLCCVGRSSVIVDLIFIMTRLFDGAARVGMLNTAVSKSESSPQSTSFSRPKSDSMMTEMVYGAFASVFQYRKESIASCFVARRTLP